MRISEDGARTQFKEMRKIIQEILIISNIWEYSRG